MSFFFACQGAFQTASVDLDAEPMLNRREAFRHGHLGTSGPEVGFNGQHLGCEFVSAFGAGPARKQAAETGGRQRLFRLIEGRPRHTEICRGFADRLTVHFVASDHLVAHLHKVRGIEKWAVDEQAVADCLRMGIECAVAPQCFPFAAPWLTHGLLLVCKLKYAALYVVSRALLDKSARTRRPSAKLPLRPQAHTA